MRNESLYDFYHHAVLPQFGLKDVAVTWSGSQQTGPDEFAHYFKLDGSEYALIFEDYDGCGRSDEYIRERVLEHHSSYEFVQPTSQTERVPTYDGFHLPRPCMYCVNVTGSFTLIKLLP